MGTKSKLYHVRFNEPIDGKRDFFFGSLSAIYDTFSSGQIGCKVENLWNLSLSEDKPYVGKKCEIIVSKMDRKTTNRLKK